MLHFRSPLSWPNSIAVTPFMKQRSDNGFSANLTLTEAINFLKEEIEVMGITSAVIYTDIEQPHVERIRKKVGNRTGACLHIKHHGKEYVITCDRWQSLEHNIYALHLLLRQWNNIVKWGIGTVEILMAGFEAGRTYSDNSNSEDIEECLKKFGLGSTATIEDAIAIYHRRAKTVTDDKEQLVKLNLQMDEIRKYFASKG